MVEQTPKAGLPISVQHVRMNSIGNRFFIRIENLGNLLANNTAMI